MNIEILVVRDPDSGTYLEVYLDGVLTDDFVQYDVDPGAGYLLSEWREETDDIEQRPGLSDALRASIVQSRIIHERSDYISDDT